MRERLVAICAAEDPHQPWNGDDPNPAPHHSIMVGTILREMLEPSEGMLKACEDAGGFMWADEMNETWTDVRTKAWRAMIQHIIDGKPDA